MQQPNKASSHCKARHLLTQIFNLNWRKGVAYGRVIFCSVYPVINIILQVPLTMHKDNASLFLYPLIKPINLIILEKLTVSALLVQRVTVQLWQGLWWSKNTST